MHTSSVKKEKRKNSFVFFGLNGKNISCKHVAAWLGVAAFIISVFLLLLLATSDYCVCEDDGCALSVDKCIGGTCVHKCPTCSTFSDCPDPTEIFRPQDAYHCHVDCLSPTVQCIASRCSYTCDYSCSESQDCLKFSNKRCMTVSDHGSVNPPCTVTLNCLSK